MPYDSRHLLIDFPRKSRFTELLMNEANARTLHGSAALIQCFLRTRYWVIDARNMIRHIIIDAIHASDSPTKTMPLCGPIIHSTGIMGTCRPIVSHDVADRVTCICNCDRFTVFVIVFVRPRRNAGGSVGVHELAVASEAAKVVTMARTPRP